MCECVFYITRPYTHSGEDEAEGDETAASRAVLLQQAMGRVQNLLEDATLDPEARELLGR